MTKPETTHSIIIKKTEIKIEELIIILRKQSMAIEDIERALLMILSNLQAEKAKLCQIN